MLEHLPIPKHRERVDFTMSTNENTATEKQDVYQRVKSQIINAIEAGGEQLAHAMAHLGEACIFSSQRHQQEAVQGNQYSVSVGSRSGQRV